ncbi:uncharacterized protein MELLADRAFT_111421 [Melampsora larici-populina 98AG31]|uniref:Uncharacterized protein n=1 Tax=Melampsora larici-populina (strain 98AG31 / pathotype 3-4-7) TaxID=747676 RepID=F4S354_MELLP|nr:uncharacterized protein MELLADRAFT_111421 [Melampsora larici-populina 98AG31]EGG00922.1 hypothetical protein MELLADRAFT_111421 [Melampsora larici-populina 98AG31]
MSRVKGKFQSVWFDMLGVEGALIDAGVQGEQAIQLSKEIGMNFEIKGDQLMWFKVQFIGSVQFRFMWSSASKSKGTTLDLKGEVCDSKVMFMDNFIWSLQPMSHQRELQTLVFICGKNCVTPNP